MTGNFHQVATDDFMRTAFERCPTGLLVVNVDGGIAVLNREVERQFGYTRDELLGQPVDMLVPGEFAARHSQLRAQYAANPTARRMGAGRDLFGRHKDGRKIPVEIGLSAITTPAGLFILATIVDISERRLMEERLRQPHKLEALGSLASGIAHDFNNILAGIMGYAELAKAAVLGTPSAVADLGVVLDTARRGRDLVNRILLFTRTSVPMRIDTDIAATVRDAIQLLRASLPSNIEIREGFDPSVPHVMADGNELHQVAMNLATNAAHAMRAQGGILEIRLEPVLVGHAFAADHPGMREGLHVRLSVSDTGTGIPPEVLARIFEPFYTTKAQGEGTGLGLAVVDRIVQSLGGTIDIKSRVGEGTRFDVYVPSLAVDTSTAKEQSVGTIGRRNILLVDDEVSLARLGQRVLESAGFDVTAHTSSLNALESFRASPQHFDLLITDNTMPHMTGLELVEKVLAIRPDMPILMVSGIGESMSIDALKERGVTRLLSKPYESALLESAVKEMIEKNPVSP